MSKLNNLTDFLTSLANAFRSKLGTTATINPQDFDSKVSEVYDAGYEQGKSEGGGGIDLSSITNWSYFNHANSRAVLMELVDYDTTSNGTNFSYMFNACSNLTTIPELDTSKGTNFNSMFYGCTALTTIPDLDTSKGTAVSYMFNNCSNLTTIPDLDTSHSTGFSYMFNNCSNLTTIPLSNTSNGTNFSYMFQSCTALTTIGGDIVLTNAATVTSMFKNCTALVDITFNGTISITGLDLHWSTALSKDSFISAINALSSSKTGLSITFSNTAKEAAFTDDEWAELIATKSNWTINLL